MRREGLDRRRGAGGGGCDRWSGYGGVGALQGGLTVRPTRQAGDLQGPPDRGAVPGVLPAGVGLMSGIMGLDLRAHLADEDGSPVCGAGTGAEAVVTRMVTLHGPAVTCSACLASATMAQAS